MSCHPVMPVVIILCLTLNMTLAPSPTCKLKMKKAVEDYKYYKHGDIIIGGIFTVNLNMDELPANTYHSVMFCNG